MAAGPSRFPRFTPAMLVIWIAVRHAFRSGSSEVGLYQYLGVEILIFATLCSGYNLVLGHAGLPSFGHGAFFGIGAYAFGLAQFNIVAEPAGSVLRLRPRAAAIAGAFVALFISHQARHLLRVDDHRFRADLLVHRDQGAPHNRRRGWLAQD